VATHKSAEKRYRQSVRRRERNRVARASLRATIRKTLETVAAGNKESAKKDLLAAERALMKAARKHLLHDKSASRRLSRLARRVSAMK